MGAINISWISLLLQGIPELTAIVTLAFVIARIPLKWSTALCVGTVLAVCVYAVRLFSFPFGVHTILSIFLLFVFLMWHSQGDLSLAVIASLASFFVTIICETICLTLLMQIFRVTPNTLSTHPVLKIVISEPHVILLFVLAYLFKKFLTKRGLYPCSL